MRSMTPPAGRLFRGAVFLAPLVLGACNPAQPEFHAPVDVAVCERHAQCGDGQVCVAGECRRGACVPELNLDCREGTVSNELSRYCCDVGLQVCNSLNECVPDPETEGVIGNQCRKHEDCPHVGEFCSAGNCYSPQGRDPCIASYECPRGERCDRTVFLCVPDQGGCIYADRFPELACDTTQLCDRETGFCLDPGGAECTPATVSSDCRPLQKCDPLGRCVQCISDDDCGPGTECNEGTGNCISAANRCESDGDCRTGRRCSPATSECVVPLCQTNQDCGDPRKRCDLLTFTCFLPPAQCNTETDEPNNSLSAAASVAYTGYAATLCRGDTDYVRFDVQPGMRYRATVTFPDYNADGTQAALLDAQGVVLDQRTLSASRDVAVSAIARPQDSTFYLRILGGGEQQDLWSYTITVVETVAPVQVSCADETSQGIEPNDTFAQAYGLAPGTTRSFARCGLGDVDFFYVDMPPLHGLEVIVEHDRTEGDLDLYLYNGTSLTNEVAKSTTSQNVERVVGVEGPARYYARVVRYQYNTNAATNQTYTLTVNLVPRPAACDADIHEPDGSLETAGALPLGEELSAIRCNNVDVDYFRLDLPADTAGDLRIGFSHPQGNLRLDLLDEAGAVVVGSDRSTQGEGANAYELVELPFSAEARTFHARVRLSGTATGQVGQRYTIRAATYDASACTRSEPVSNDAVLSGQCVGTFPTEHTCVGPVLPSPLEPPSFEECGSAQTFVPGCATACGASDTDWYRVGTLNDAQLVVARLEHDPSLGALQLAIARISQPGNVPVIVANDSNVNRSATLEVSFLSPTVEPIFAREYAVRVLPIGGSGDFSAAPYALGIDVGPPCVADVFEPNQSWVSSTWMRAEASPDVPYDEAVDATLCGHDVDVYELYAFRDEKVTVTLDGPPGLLVSIGTRPPLVTDEPITLPCGAGVVVGAERPEDCPVPADAPPPDGVQRSVAHVLNDRAQPLFALVKRATPTAVGPYTLQFQVENP